MKTIKKTSMKPVKEINGRIIYELPRNRRDNFSVHTASGQEIGTYRTLPRAEWTCLYVSWCDRRGGWFVDPDAPPAPEN